MNIEEINDNLKKIDIKIGTLCISRNISAFFSTTFMLTGGIGLCEVIENVNLCTTTETAISTLGLGVSISVLCYKQKQINELLNERSRTKQKKLSLKKIK
ncbi:MAG: hypothetical protein NC181_05230 [Clostridium sp.]|nr:hypothetical protein [Clostridium sp.]MCM1443959.1 hypothetical protein [Candidatus Amulumruptor caecigallinarius]